MLIAKGADVNAQNANGLTPKQMAADAEEAAIVKLLETKPAAKGK